MLIKLKEASDPLCSALLDIIISYGCVWKVGGDKNHWVIKFPRRYSFLSLGELIFDLIDEHSYFDTYSVTVGFFEDDGEDSLKAIDVNDLLCSCKDSAFASPHSNVDCINKFDLITRSYKGRREYTYENKE